MTIPRAYRALHRLFTLPDLVHLVTVEGRPWLTDRHVALDAQALPGLARSVGGLADGCYMLTRTKPPAWQTPTDVAGCVGDLLEKWTARGDWRPLTTERWGVFRDDAPDPDDPPPDMRLLRRGDLGAPGHAWVDAGLWRAWTGAVPGMVAYQPDSCPCHAIRVARTAGDMETVCGYVMPMHAATPPLPRDLPSGGVPASVGGPG